MAESLLCCQNVTADSRLHNKEQEIIDTSAAYLVELPSPTIPPMQALKFCTASRGSSISRSRLLWKLEGLDSKGDNIPSVRDIAPDEGSRTFIRSLEGAHSCQLSLDASLANRSIRNHTNSVV